MAGPLDWADPEWSDPDGGTVVLHGTLPTVVYPNVLRPRYAWDGLALLETPDLVELWEQEEADEAESQGVNLTYAMLSGGAFGRYAEGISMPEPRRLQRNAVRHNRPVFFLEPMADDPDWNDFLTREAKAMSHWKKLLNMVRIKKRWKKAVQRRIFDVTPPPKGQSSDYASASVMASAWWDINCEMSSSSLNKERNDRYAARVRGALASLRSTHGDKAVLMLVLHQPQREALMASLRALPAAEEISSTSTDTLHPEEE
jgi:hypothetical protein